ncbi:hypothetical protein M7I_6859 [Glarea lozoyensis 74030]|nr:hypothetical protein M7I_6859 [Glarea lozoyensis 74030]
MSEFSMGVPGDNTQTLRDLGLAQGALSIGRDSDVRPLALPDEATDNDFLFIVPPRDVSEEPRRNSSRRGSTPLSMILDMQSEDPQGHVEPLELDQENLMEGEEGEEFDNSEHPVPTVLYDPTQPLDMSLTMSVPRAPGLVGTLATTRKHKQAKVSVHGIEYPSLPAGVVKKLATTFARTAGNNKTKLNKETLDAIIQASDWFFEQVSDDLGAYAEHGRRKTIDETDVITLMARQRQINASNTPFSLAQKYLPRELLQEMRMVPPPKSKNQH